MSDESRFSLLFHKYVNGNADEAEHMEFMSMVDSGDMQEQLNTLVDAEMRTTYVDERLTEQERQTILSNIYGSVVSDAVKYPIGTKDTSLKTYALWKRIAVAAAVAFIAICIYFFNDRHVILNLFQNPGSAQYANDIAPGKNTATLTLANGKTIALSNTKTGVVIDGSDLKYNDGSIVDPSSRTGGRDLSSGGKDPSMLRDDGQVNTLAVSTPRGGTYQVILPDGTRAWLNAGSVLKFPVRFSGTERVVELTGEAYFEVATSYFLAGSSSVSGKSSSSLSSSAASFCKTPSLRERRTKQSFKVISGNQELTVLGTHFNVNAYSDELSVKTTLMEGSVKVSAWMYASRHAEFSSASWKSGDNLHDMNGRAGIPDQVRHDERQKGGHDERQKGGDNERYRLGQDEHDKPNEHDKPDEHDKPAREAIILKPGQQSTLTANKQIKIKEVDVEEAIAWKNGYFSFNDDKIQDIMQTISRWYDIEVSYERNITKDGFNGKISRNKNISQVLKMLEDTKLVHFNVEGRRVIVRE